MSPDPEAGSSWFAHTDTTDTPGPRQDAYGSRHSDRAAEDGPLNAPDSEDAFVITELPQPPAPAAAKESRSIPSPAGDRKKRDGVGLWERLGDRRATAVTAGVAGLVLLGVLLVMSMVTDGITFTSDETQPAGGGTSNVGSSGGSSPGDAVLPQPSSSPSDGQTTPVPPPVADSPSSSDLPASRQPDSSASEDDDDDGDHDTDDDEDDEDDHDDDDDEDDVDDDY